PQTDGRHAHRAGVASQIREGHLPEHARWHPSGVNITFQTLSFPASRSSTGCPVRSSQTRTRLGRRTFAPKPPVPTANRRESGLNAMPETLSVAWPRKVNSSVLVRRL